MKIRKLILSSGMLVILFFVFSFFQVRYIGADDYKAINSKAEFCAAVQEGEEKFEWRHSFDSNPAKIKVFIPPHINRSLQMAQANYTGDTRFKAALKYRNPANNYASSYDGPYDELPIEALLELEDEKVFTKSPGNKTHEIFYFGSSASYEGGGDWLYYNLFSGDPNRVDFIAYVDVSKAKSWCATYEETGSLRVNIEPDKARDAGAKWRRTGTDTWRDSGYTETGLDPGDYTVEFKDVESWTKPSNKQGTVEIGETTTLTGDYLQQSGSLQVFIDPEDVRESGAWKLDWDDEWRGHGEVKDHIAPGVHNIEFKEASGWYKPENQVVEVEHETITKATGAYVARPGSLKVILGPAGQEPESSGQWSVDGGGTWHSTKKELVLALGTYLISFKQVDDWHKPDTLEVSIEPGVFYQRTFHYGDDGYGELKVSIQPEDVKNEARWRLAGDDTWHDSEFVKEEVSTGSRTIEFKEVEGWVKPADKSVIIEEGQRESVTGRYEAEKSSLTVEIIPEEAQVDGRWRIKGEESWRASDYKYIDIQPDLYEIEYKDIVGWHKPANQEVTITQGMEAELKGEYKEITWGSIKITIEPDAANEAGAQWTYEGAGQYYDSKDSALGLDAGSYQVSFTEIDGWYRPEPIDVEVEADRLSEETGVYERHTGSLRVLIEPAEAQEMGAWKRYNTEIWRYHDDVENNIPTGQHTVEFKDISEDTKWQGKPRNQQVTINKDEEAEITGTYLEEPDVTILPGVLMLLLDDEEPVGE